MRLGPALRRRVTLLSETGRDSLGCGVTINVVTRLRVSLLASHYTLSAELLVLSGLVETDFCHVLDRILEMAEEH